MQTFMDFYNEYRPRTMDDFYEKYGELYDQSIEDMIAEFRRAPQGTLSEWPVIPAARLIKIWNDYATTGVVRDARGMADIAERVQYLVARLDASTMLSGHTPIDPAEHLEALGYEFSEEEYERFLDFLEAPSGQYRLSDYGLKPLVDLSIQLFKATSPEQQLLIVDQMLNIVHQRGDMAENFIEGGRSTLMRLATQ